jgi:hypothetical protein
MPLASPRVARSEGKGTIVSSLNCGTIMGSLTSDTSMSSLTSDTTMLSLKSGTTMPSLNGGTISSPPDSHTQHLSSPLTALPTELFEKVLEHVDMRTLLRSQRVNKRFQAATQHSPKIRRVLWLHPNEQMQPKVPECTSHTTNECPPDGFRCKWREPVQVVINPLIMHLLDMGNPGHRLPLERVLQHQAPLRPEDDHEHDGECEPGCRICEFLNDDRQTQIAIRQREAKEASERGQLDYTVPFKSLEITFSTIKNCLAAMDDGINHSWKNMIVVQGMSVPGLVVGYKVIEKLGFQHFRDSGAVVSREGRYEKEHLVNGGPCGPSITVAELIAVLKKKHRDHNMQE